MKCYPVCILLSMFLPGYLYSQVDSAYIGSFKRNFSIQTYFYQKFTALAYEVDGVETNYQPNSPVGIGLGIDYKSFSLMAGRTFGFLRDKERGGETELQDFQYHYYGRKFIADFFFQRYKGFYTEEGTGNKKVISLYPEIKLAQYGLSGQYVFNYRRFSYRAAFHHREKQLKSAGSFHLGGGLYYNDLSGDESLVVNAHNRVSNYQIGASGGYAYTFVIKKDFFASLDFAIGVNLGAGKFSDLIKSPDVTPSIFPRVSLGYNSETWSVGINAVINRIYVSHTHGANIMFDTGRMNVKFIKRIKMAPKILRDSKYLNQ